MLMKDLYKILIISSAGMLLVCLENIPASTLTYSRSQKEIQDKDGLEGLRDFTNAIETNIRPELHSKLAPLVVAIRYAENGGSGREYGVLHPKVKPTYRSQAGWCAATVQKNWDRYEQQGCDTENFDQYIAFLGKKYCPIDDTRDIMGLNKHWISNVSRFYNQFKLPTL